MTKIRLSDGRYFIRWVGVKPLFDRDDRIAKTYLYKIQAQADADKLAQQGYKRLIVDQI